MVFVKSINDMSEVFVVKIVNTLWSPTSTTLNGLTRGSDLDIHDY